MTSFFKNSSIIFTFIYRYFDAIALADSKHRMAGRRQELLGLLIDDITTARSCVDVFVTSANEYKNEVSRIDFSIAI